MKDTEKIGILLSSVTTSASSFESRWTLGALHRVDAELYRRLLEQRSLYNTAAVTGSQSEVEKHAAAMCRGWQAACRAMEQAGVSDDAYMLGRCRETGTVVAIGQQRAGAARAVEVHGEDVIWVTPDEVAQVFANLQAFRPIAELKRTFPGTVIDVRRRSSEAA